MDLLRALFTRRWWWATLLVVVMMGVMARLGFWQLDRLQERREANAALAVSLAATPLDVAGELPQDVESLKDRLAVASGTFDFEQQLVLLVQNWQSSSGVHLITPLVLPGGDTAVLVDRGWIPDDQVNPQGLARYEVAGPTTVEGPIALSQVISRNPNAAPEDPQSEWYRVDVAAIQQQLPYQLLPFYIIQGPESRDTLPYRSLPPVDLSEGPHLSYAFQWFIFSVGLGVGYLALVHKTLQKSRGK